MTPLNLPVVSGGAFIRRDRSVLFAESDLRADPVFSSAAVTGRPTKWRLVFLCWYACGCPRAGFSGPAALQCRPGCNTTGSRF